MSYIGVLKSQIDWELVVKVTERLSDLSFVFIGPEGHLESADKQRLGRLRRMPNTHFLGGKSVESLSAYTKNSDICIMPYKIDDYTKYIFPIKVNEYLAAGKPTIGTPIRTLQDFAEVVDLAATPADWCAALERQVQTEFGGKEAAGARQAVAKKYDWQVLVDRIAKSICALAGDQYVKQFERVVAE